MVLAERTARDLVCRERAICGLPAEKGVELRVAERRAWGKNREANQAPALGCAFLE